jgi:hypothetical protein
MPRYRFVVRHSSYADLEDDEAGTELPDDALRANSLQRSCVN